MYKDTKTVSIGTPVPKGWLIKSYNDPNSTLDLICLIGAPYGAVQTVVLNQILPTGWVIKSYNDANSTMTIKYTGT